jgi:hypothetical protein
MIHNINNAFLFFIPFGPIRTKAYDNPEMTPKELREQKGLTRKEDIAGQGGG